MDFDHFWIDFDIFDLLIDIFNRKYDKFICTLLESG